MIFDFNGTDINVEIPENFTPVDAIVIVRAQAFDEPGVDVLSMGVTDHTGGIVQAGMLSLIGSSEYAEGGYDDDE